MGAKHQKRIALLIFALSPEAELQQKGLTGETGLYTLLNQHTLKLANALGTPYFHFTEKEQQGGSFGERYTNAIKEIFSRGFDGIITIGNDTPGLSSRHLQTAFKNLLAGNSVIGPSADGGFYLLAIPRSSFSEEAFLSVSWKTSRVFRQMQHCLQEKNSRLWVLNTLGDLDSRSDIAIVLDKFIKIPSGIRRALMKVRLNGFSAKDAFIFFYSFHPHTRILNRGSPVLAA
ncbi:TIGR04282 family arsenosugar biosynthesis glycosyltransferase [Lentiprolixibacter aurantiacus]|uniref:DUF2064 domain-containing protein n=1 Tax=Lentiprolixibacter aurantiacus TaxID=2993939 RepID=A0AAE3MJ72_9FLAO|nr:DUF2064 domain-containing protein [Lentiprolixibacter aurantiacus]MCX2718563.1 DUF2064 domain-containing protein [Lentiprolixibacter aurantiacus]